jgi:drug/metabolite transporter (DMT)-like permease
MKASGRTALAIILAVLAFGSAFPAVKLGLRDFSPGQLALLRFAVASVVLVSYMAIRRLPPAPFSEWRMLVFLGLANIAAYHLLFNLGQRTISASAASMLVNMSPIFTTAFAALLHRERAPLRTWAGLLIAFSGAALIAVSERGAVRFSAGAVLVLCAALLQGLSFVVQRPAVARHGATAVTAASVWIGTAVLAALFGGETVNAVRASASATIGAVAYAGAVSTVVGLVTWAFVMNQMPAARAAPYLMLVPIAATGGALLLIGETPQLSTLIGGVVTLAGVAVGQGWLRTLWRANVSAMPLSDQATPEKAT